MELTRRGFVRRLACAAALLAACPRRLLAAGAGTPLIRALRARFPGRTRPPRDAEIRAPGRWAG
ncbi:MAG: hypothetical protein FJ225_09320 [Lentisphaerae bacterium]|nr:hypothetical protein [Lentisphaerota bacterium]